MNKFVSKGLRVRASELNSSYIDTLWEILIGLLENKRGHDELEAKSL